MRPRLGSEKRVGRGTPTSYEGTRFWGARAGRGTCRPLHFVPVVNRARSVAPPPPRGRRRSGILSVPRYRHVRHVARLRPGPVRFAVVGVMLPGQAVPSPVTWPGPIIGAYVRAFPAGAGNDSRARSSVRSSPNAAEGRRPHAALAASVEASALACRSRRGPGTFAAGRGWLIGRVTGTGQLVGLAAANI